MHQPPRIAIIDPNTLSALGLKAILQQLVPSVEVDIFGAFSEFQANKPECYFHYFTAFNIVLENRPFFLQYRRKTIVLTMSTNAVMNDFHTLCINVPEKTLIRSILMLQQSAHAHGKNIPEGHRFMDTNTPELTHREIEVLSLIVQGFINKEIAERLNIALTTVITHRKNIMEKLGAKSVSALTIYAVMHGYVDINKI